MKHTKEEIIGALKVIKEECEAHPRSCIDCPLCVRGCEVAHNGIPSAWQIAELEPEIWRAFKS